jgi:predicted component of type VI protein secretion system
MAYIVVSFKDQEIGRWPLNGPLSIGRSTECDVVVRDILLSRRHCQIVPYRSGWIANDLKSKNGTRCEGRLIDRRGLADGDLLTMGKTTVRFQMGKLAPNHRPPPKRPADPFEALSGTVSEFDPKEVEAFRESHNMPAPRPMPREPDSYADEDLYSLLSGIASSSWDSIYAQASRPRRPIPRVKGFFTPPATSGGAATATAVASASATMTLPRRSRLAFSEDLQVPEGRPQRLVRPASPQAAGLVAARPAAGFFTALSTARQPGWVRRIFRRLLGRR